MYHLRRGSQHQDPSSKTIARVLTCTLDPTQAHTSSVLMHATAFLFIRTEVGGGEKAEQQQQKLYGRGKVQGDTLHVVGGVKRSVKRAC